MEIYKTITQQKIKEMLRVFDDMTTDMLSNKKLL